MYEPTEDVQNNKPNTGVIDIVKKPVNTTSDNVNYIDSVATMSKVEVSSSKEDVVKPDKRRHFLAAFFLSFMFGVFGVDRFYLGKWGTGFLKLITMGGFGIWAMVDTSMIASGVMRDKQGNALIDAERYKKFARNFLLIFSIITISLLALFVGAVIFTFIQFMQSGGLENLIPGASNLGLPESGTSSSFDFNQLIDQIKVLIL